MMEKEFQINDHKVILRNGKLAIFKLNKDQFGNQFYSCMYKEHDFDAVEKESLYGNKSNQIRPYIHLDNIDILNFIKGLIDSYIRLKFDKKMEEKVFNE